MGSLFHLESNFDRVGWFIPPYVQQGVLTDIAVDIRDAGAGFTQDDLQRALARLYEPEGLAAMVLHRYPITPIIQDYSATIREAIEAHFMGLHHVAVGGLIPVIEGAGRRIASQRGIKKPTISGIFMALAVDCKNESRNNKIGDVEEIASMMDSFSGFAKKLFIDSSKYALGDGTNRNGIAHGAYVDNDFGSPLNFYKIIAAVDFLTFTSSIRARMWCFAPNDTPETRRLALYFRSLERVRSGWLPEAPP